MSFVDTDAGEARWWTFESGEQVLAFRDRSFHAYFSSPRYLDSIVSAVIDLDGLPAAFERILSGGHRGRIVVRIDATA